MAFLKSSFMIILVVICYSLGFEGCYSQVPGDGGGDSLRPCIQKLMPCQPYLKGSPPPTAACCVPLKQMDVAGDTKCLCAIFNNQDMLSKLNVTQEDALHLVRNCGANDDVSLCNKDAAPASPSIPAAPPTKGSETSAQHKKKNAAAAISQAGISAAIFSLISVLIF